MDSARARQELTARLDEVPGALSSAFERTSLVAGVVYLRRFRCGQSSCHCAQGSLHEALTLTTYRETKGNRRIQPTEDLEALRAATERYRGVRKMRRSFLRWSRRVLQLLDQLEAARTKLATSPKKSKGK